MVSESPYLKIILLFFASSKQHSKWLHPLYKQKRPSLSLTKYFWASTWLMWRNSLAHTIWCGADKSMCCTNKKNLYSVLSFDPFQQPSNHCYHEPQQRTKSGKHWRLCMLNPHVVTSNNWDNMLKTGRREIRLLMSICRDSSQGLTNSRFFVSLKILKIKWSIVL